MKPATVADQKGIWVASYPKSGNTWVRIFIHNLLRELRGEVGSEQDINALNQHTTWELSAAAYEELLGKPVAQATPAEIAKTRYSVQEILAQKQKGPFFIKTHNSVANVEGYPSINLDITLAAIYIVRNPLDVAISYAHHSGLTVDSTIDFMALPGAASPTTVNMVYEFPDTWSAHAASWLAISNRPVHVVRYEDMLHSPERVFAGLAKFLRMKHSPDQLARAIEKSSFKAVAQQEATKGFVEKPPTSKAFFREGRADQWQEGLSKVQIKSIVASHAPMMQRFGYLIPDCGRVIA